MNQTVYSPFHGRVEDIFISDAALVYEWERLFSIRTNEGVVKEVSIGISGTVVSVEIKPGQEVTMDTALAIIKDDMLITGSD
ncbi:hypothetical protein EV207_105168 [Scopulibacillus darangshiensis]|uniref:Biotin-dependent enzyme n=1 Tax=Scopulibacillus darangshiensis TaxID=442528 RepID=A0A4R2P6V3_9BACL|nr:hypothetical protein [Scopulibacillus darangshiensis]TCP30639.1 hypothetical protein EV207_105168 [Scopulibacillus darangshiensis]